MQRFLVVFHGTSHLSLVFSWSTLSPKGLSLHRENTKLLFGYSMKYDSKALITKIDNIKDGIV